MSQKCLYLRQRHKKGELYYFCTKHRENTVYDCYRGCLDKEYKIIPIKKVNKTNKVRKATEISRQVKKKVWERDNHCCIFCTLPVDVFFANSHYIKRSQLGKGVEENIFTACPTCHHEFDDTPKRKYMLPVAKKYLMSKYDYWNEEMLIYKK